MINNVNITEIYIEEPAKERNYGQILKYMIKRKDTVKQLYINQNNYFYEH